MYLPTIFNHASEEFCLRIRHVEKNVIVDYFSTEGATLDYNEFLRLVEQGHMDYDNEFDYEKINLSERDQDIWKIEMPLSITDQFGTIDLLIEFSQDGAWFDYVNKDGNSVSIADAMVLLTII